MKAKLTLRQQIKEQKLRAERFWTLVCEKNKKIEDLERLTLSQSKEIDRLKDDAKKLIDYRVKFRMLKNMFKPAILNIHKDSIGWDRDKQDRYFDNI